MMSQIFKDIKLHPMDVTLTGAENFRNWCLRLKSAFMGKGLWGHIDGSTPRPDTSAASFSATVTGSDAAAASTTAATLAWEATDQALLSYMHFSIDISLHARIEAYTTTRALWLYLQSTFVQVGGARQHQLRCASLSARQGTMTIQQFYTHMCGLWANHAALEPQWPAGIADLYYRFRDSERLCQFLDSLRPEFESVGSLLLHRDPMPSLESAIVELLMEETRQQTRDAHHTPSSETVLAAMHMPTAGRPAATPTASQAAPGTQGAAVHRPVCSFCHKIGHTRERCWKLKRQQQRTAPGPGTGLPTAAGPGMLGAAPTALSTTPAGPSSSPAWQQFQEFLQFQQLQLQAGSSSPSVSGSAASASESAYNAGIGFSPWLLDSGATQHMTADATILTDCTPCDRHISTASGHSLPASSIGSITSTSDPSGLLTLPFVLHVPKLSQSYFY